MMILAAILAVLVITNVVEVWMILVLAFLLGIANAVDMPTRQSFAFELVGRDEVEQRRRAQLGDVQRRPGHRPGRGRSRHRRVRRRAGLRDQRR